MYVCICNAVTEKHIAKAVEAGCRTFRELRGELGVGACCGRCTGCAREVLRQNIEDERAPGFLTAGYSPAT